MGAPKLHGSDDGWWWPHGQGRYQQGMVLLVLLLLSSLASAAELDFVRVFTGTNHARILVVTQGSPSTFQTRSSPAMGAVPARAVLILGATGPGKDGSRVVPVGEGGLQRLSVSPTGDDLQLTIDLDAARVLRVENLSSAAFIMDVRVEGAPADPALPEPDQLRSWLDGVSLVRAAGGPPRDRPLVVVDAGHGGFDHGAVGTTGTREADIALQIALRTARGLEDRLGVEVLLTRSDDTFVTLRDRAALANARDADLFLSIHANAAPGPTAWGIETYSLDTASDAGAARVAARENTLVREQRADLGETDPLLANLLTAGTNQLSKDLARDVQHRVVSRLQEAYGETQIRNLGSKTALFYVLVSTRMPAILFETSFVSNPGDERRLRTPQFQQLTADALVEAVGVWLERQGGGKP